MKKQEKKLNMYEVLNSNGERHGAEILDMLLDNEHGVSLNRLMYKCKCNAFQIRSMAERLRMLWNDNTNYYTIDRLRKIKGESDLYELVCDYDYEGPLRRNYSTEIFKLRAVKFTPYPWN